MSGLSIASGTNANITGLYTAWLTSGTSNLPSRVVSAPTPAAPAPAASVTLTGGAAPLTSNRLIDLTGYTGNVQATFAVGGNSSLVNTGGLYKVDDSNGGIDLSGNGSNVLHPGDAGYTAAALSRSVVSFTNRDTSASATLQGGSLYASYEIAGGTAADVPNHPGGGTFAYFGLQNANVDGYDHLKIQSNAFHYEDQYGGGDKDHNDLIFSVNVSGTRAAAPVGSPTTTLGANLVQNGSFEATRTPANAVIVTGNDVAGWQISGSAGLKAGQYQGSLSQELDLSGLSTTNTNSTITQNLNTVAGQTYRVSFDVFTGAGTGLDSSGTVNASFGGSLIASGLQGGSITDLNNGRVRYTYDVTATGSSTALTFGTAGANGQIAQIDNVAVQSVTTTPAPSSPPPAASNVDLAAFGSVAHRTLNGLNLNGGTFTFQSPNEIVYVSGDVNISGNTKFQGTGTIIVSGNANIQGNLSYADQNSNLNLGVQQTLSFGNNVTSVVGNYLTHNTANTASTVFNGALQNTSGGFVSDRFVYNGAANSTNIAAQAALSSPPSDAVRGASEDITPFNPVSAPSKAASQSTSGKLFLDPHGDFLKILNQQVIRPLGATFALPSTNGAASGGTAASGLASLSPSGNTAPAQIQGSSGSAGPSSTSSPAASGQFSLASGNDLVGVKSLASVPHSQQNDEAATSNTALTHPQPSSSLSNSGGAKQKDDTSDDEGEKKTKAVSSSSSAPLTKKLQKAAAKLTSNSKKEDNPSKSKKLDVDA